VYVYFKKIIPSGKKIMTNFEKIKKLLKHGHKVQIGKSVYIGISKSGNLFSDDFVPFSESEVNERIFCKTPPIPIPYKFEILKEGDKVDILENLRELEKFDYYSECKNMIGTKNNVITQVKNNYYGVHYIINGYFFPHNCVSPSIEDEEVDLGIVTIQENIGELKFKGKKYKLTEIKEV